MGCIQSTTTHSTTTHSTINETKDESNCPGNDKELDDISKCDYSHRLFAALKDYSALNPSNKQSQNDIFAQLCEDKYTNLLNDWIHFITTHSNQIDVVHNQLINKHNFSQCTINQCQLVVRHYRNNYNRRNEKNIKNKPTKDAKDIFFGDLMDAIHQYIFHLYDLGLRLKSERFEEKEISESKEENESYNCYDYKFEKLKKIIETKHKKLGAIMDRFTAENNKFNIATTGTSNNNNKKGKETFMDALGNYLMENKGNINEIKSFYKYLNDEQLDSDTIKYEIPFENILKEMKTIKDLFKKFLFNLKLSCSSFSTGIIFYYWDWYRPQTVNINEINTDADNNNDHGGFNIKDLFVPKKYETFKEEILNHISINEFNDLVMVKVREYIGTHKAKKIYAKEPLHKHLHYGIKEGEKLSQYNIISLILYCDFSTYCTNFTASFRTATSYESLGNIKERHREYWWMAKTLRETIQYFGNRGRGDRDEWDAETRKYKYINKASGPFFCGMSKVMEMPQFFIRLCSPTSTSVHKEIAANFAKRTGIIIELSNKEGMGKHLRTFDCSWVSRFVEEDERLFCGGDYPIRIKSIRIINTHQNFELFFGVMYVFDCMVSGTFAGKQPTEKENKIIKKLMDFKLGVIASTPFDKYIENTFILFCNMKKGIMINLSNLHSDFKRLNHLIVSETECVRRKYVLGNEENESKNLLHPLILKLFENASHITIYGTHTMGGDWGQYIFSLISFLNVIKTSLTWTKITIKGAWGWDRYGNQIHPWFSTLWLSKSELLKAKYKENNYLISFRQKYMKNSRGNMEDCVTITRV